MGFLDLFLVALMPVLKTLLVTAIGLFLALDRVNLLGAVARHHLNNLVFFVHTPALVVSNIAETITASNIVSLWFMPVNILLTFIVGSAFGWILVKITRAPPHLHGLVIGCCAAGNLGNLPLIIIPAICQEKDSPFGDSSTCSTNGEAYASLSMGVGAIYIWTYVYNIMRAYASKSQKDSSTHSITIINDSGTTSEIFPDSHLEALLSKDSTSSEDCETRADILPTGSDNRMKASILENIILRLKNSAKNINLKMLFAPSTIATIVGLVIGIVSPLRKLLIGDNAPLRVVESSASMLGDASIPAMTLIVGANLLRGLKKSELSIWLVIGITAIRCIALPLTGIFVVKAAYHFGMVGLDSLYQFVLMLQYALPPAMAIGTITQLFEVGESESSVIMLWNYAVASFSLTLWSTYYMWLLS